MIFEIDNISIMKMTDPRNSPQLPYIMGSTKNSALTKVTSTLSFRMTRPSKRFNFNKPTLNTTKLGLMGLSVCNSVFNVKEKKNIIDYSQNYKNNALNVYSTG